MLVLIFCVKYSQIKIYWVNIAGANAIENVMPRNCSFVIHANWELVVDGSTTPNERMNERFWRIRPMLHRTNSKRLLKVEERRHSGEDISERVKKFCLCYTQRGSITLQTIPRKGHLPKMITWKSGLGVGPATAIRLT